MAELPVKLLAIKLWQLEFRLVWGLKSPLQTSTVRWEAETGEVARNSEADMHAANTRTHACTCIMICTHR